MPLMSAALSGKLSHWWDMQTSSLGDLTNGNTILDRIGGANTALGLGQSYAILSQVSGMDGSGIQSQTSASFSNGETIVAPMIHVYASDTSQKSTSLWGPGSGSFTLTYWDWAEEDYGSQTLYGPALSENSSVPTQDRCLITRFQNGEMYAQAFKTSSEQTSANVTVTPESGRWNHWAWVVDKAAGDIDLYVNGSGFPMMSGQPHVQLMNYPGRLQNQRSDASLNFHDFVGSRSSQSNGTQLGLSGYKMDSLGVFGEALTSGNIVDLYNGGSGVFLGTYDDSISEPFTGLQHYYNFEDTSPISSGSTLTDIKGSADLTLEVLRGGAIGDGSNEFYLESGVGISGQATSGNQDGDWNFTREIYSSGVGQDASWNVAASGEDYSISFWKKGNSGGTDRGLFGIGNKDRSDFQTYGHIARGVFDVSDNFWYQGQVGRQGSTVTNLNVAGAFTGWHHYVISVNRDDLSQVTTWRNGAVISTKLHHDAGPALSYLGYEPNDNYEFSLMGVETWDGITDNGIHDDPVNIDEFGLWNVALDQRHVDLLYNAGSGTFYEFTPEVATGASTGTLGGFVDSVLLSTGSSAGTLGGFVIADPIVSSGSSSGTLGVYTAGTHVSVGSTSGDLGVYVEAVKLETGSASGDIGVYVEADPVVSSGSAAGTLGGYILADPIVSSGSFAGTLGGFVLADPVVSSGSSSGSLGAYISTVAVISSGSATATIGGYVVAIPLADPTGVITIPSPPVTVYSWDTSKPDPSGLRHIESGPYLPAANLGTVGGFNKAAASGTPLTMLSQDDLSPSATVVGETKALTVGLGQPSGVNFDNASAGDIVDGLRIYNVKMWMNDTSDISASGISPLTYYRKDSTWTEGIALTSASSGVAQVPTTLASGIDLGSIENTGLDSSVTDYVYLFIELPSGTYGTGALGGTNGGYSLRISYDYTEEGKLL